jgi:hypothetical protein
MLETRKIMKKRRVGKQKRKLYQVQEQQHQHQQQAHHSVATSLSHHRLPLGCLYFSFLHHSIDANTVSLYLSILLVHR